MNNMRFSRNALTVSAAMAFLAGCGGSHPPIGAPGAVLQSRATPTHAERGGSWMLPEAKQQDLIYVLGPKKDYVVSYSTGTVIASFAGPPLGGVGACSDDQGNVFIPGNEENLGVRARGNNTNKQVARRGL